MQSKMSARADGLRLLHILTLLKIRSRSVRGEGFCPKAVAHHVCCRRRIAAGACSRSITTIVAASADATDTAEGAGQRIAPTRAIARKRLATCAAGTCVGRGRRLMEGRLRRVPIMPCVVGSPLDASNRPCKIRGPISILHPEAPFPGSDACGQRCCQEHDVLQGQDPTFRCGLQLL